MKRQAGRPGKNSVPVAQDLKGKTSRQLLGEQVGESQDQIRRYIRLTELITPILDMVDIGKIAIRPAVELTAPPAKQMGPCPPQDSFRFQQDVLLRSHNGP